MSLIKLGIHRDYCPKWGLWEGLREIVQNALDEDDKGNALRLQFFNYKDGTQSIVFENAGSGLPAKAMLVGYSTKANDPGSRGQYGEGLKMAMLALLRLGVKVRVYSEGKSYTPEFHYDQNLGCETLAIRVGKSALCDITQVRVEGLSAEAWTTLSKRFMRWASWNDCVKTQYGTLIKDPKAEGFVYAKGIFVCRVNSLRYGYDLSGLELDRDRSMPYMTELEAQTGLVFAAAVNSSSTVTGADLLAAVQDGKADGRQVSSSAATILAKAIREAYPDADAFAFSPTQAEKAPEGKKVVTLPASAEYVLCGHLPSVEEIVRQGEVVRVLDDGEITLRQEYYLTLAGKCVMTEYTLLAAVLATGNRSSVDHAKKTAWVDAGSLNDADFASLLADLALRGASTSRMIATALVDRILDADCSGETMMEARRKDLTAKMLQAEKMYADATKVWEKANKDAIDTRAVAAKRAEQQAADVKATALAALRKELLAVATSEVVTVDDLNAMVDSVFSGAVATVYGA